MLWVGCSGHLLLTSGFCTQPCAFCVIASPCRAGCVSGVMAYLVAGETWVPAVAGAHDLVVFHLGTFPVMGICEVPFTAYVTVDCVS